ncbi:hypothetical protein K438DRAFT_1754817 [Mycena galopus ATCC 62051]|nr:hypothetical protein K438DRAFT_1754817 [Mycena galopus ATCC 62051]
MARACPPAFALRELGRVGSGFWGDQRLAFIVHARKKRGSKQGREGREGNVLCGTAFTYTSHPPHRSAKTSSVHCQVLQARQPLVFRRVPSQPPPSPRRYPTQMICVGRQGLVARRFPGSLITVPSTRRGQRPSLRRDSKQLRRADAERALGRGARSTARSSGSGNSTPGSPPPRVDLKISETATHKMRALVCSRVYFAPITGKRSENVSLNNIETR